MNLRLITAAANHKNSSNGLRNILVGMILTAFTVPVLLMLLILGMGFIVSGLFQVSGEGRASLIGQVDGGWSPPSYGSITSFYGERINAATGLADVHTGIDIANGCGSPIFSIADGEVTHISKDLYGGVSVWIKHSEELITRYHHSYENEIYVREGHEVFAGQYIADQGSTGLSAGCHLHFEVFIGGCMNSHCRVDPKPFLESIGVYDLISTGKPIELDDHIRAQVCIAKDLNCKVSSIEK